MRFGRFHLVLQQMLQDHREREDGDPCVLWQRGYYEYAIKFHTQDVLEIIQENYKKHPSRSPDLVAHQNIWRDAFGDELSNKEGIGKTLYQKSSIVFLCLSRAHNPKQLENSEFIEDPDVKHVLTLVALFREHILSRNVLLAKINELQRSQQLLGKNDFEGTVGRLIDLAKHQIPHHFFALDEPNLPNKEGLIPVLEDLQALIPLIEANHGRSIEAMLPPMPQRKQHHLWIGLMVPVFIVASSLFLHFGGKDHIRLDGLVGKEEGLPSPISTPIFRYPPELDPPAPSPTSTPIYRYQPQFDPPAPSPPGPPTWASSVSSFLSRVRFPSVSHVDTNSTDVQSDLAGGKE
jgi:hypothetical protein